MESSTLMPQPRWNSSISSSNQCLQRRAPLEQCQRIMVPPPTSPIAKLNISAPGIEKLLRKLNEKKAFGPDSIPNQFPVNTAKATSLIPGKIFSQSLYTGTLPGDWRDANISPIFKKDDRNVASNYRPVSLTCVSCKILEHIIVKHMLDHLDAHHVLSKLQHGFCAGLSCKTQLLCTTFDLLRVYDGAWVDIAILDFSKAFDTVPHHHLLAKLCHYGIHGKSLTGYQASFKWLTSRVMS